MFYIIPAWIASLIGMYLFGYHMRGLVKRVIDLEKVVQSKVDRKPLLEEPKSELLDPDDPIQEALWERQKLEKRLNPDE